MNTLEKVRNQIRPFMEQNGFQQTRTCYYKVCNNIAFCVEFEKPGLLYVHCYAIPLFIPAEHRYYTYSFQLSGIMEKELSPAAKNVRLEDWCEAICKRIEKNIFPLWRKIKTPRQLTAFMGKKTLFTKNTPRCPELFIQRLQLFTDLYEINMEVLDASLEHYRMTIISADYLTQNVKDKYLKEAEQIEQLQTVRSVEDFCKETIQKTFNTCFKKC